jgi:hypothetical protein
MPRRYKQQKYGTKIMKLEKHLRKIIIVVLLCIAGVLQTSKASLTLTIDSLTANELTFTIDGTFDTAPNEGWLAIKNDWSHNQGFHTEMFSGTPSITFNNLLIGGSSVSGNITSSSETWGDAVFFGGAMSAGTTVSGTVTLAGTGMFIPANLGTLELLSGFTRPPGHDDWARLEFTATVPEPASAMMIGFGGALIVLFRRFHGRA